VNVLLMAGFVDSGRIEKNDEQRLSGFGAKRSLR